MAFDPRPKVSMVVEESPWTEFFRSLPDMLSTYVMGQQQMEWQAAEAEKDREYRKSLMYIEDQLADENRLQQQQFDLTQTASQLGVLPEKVKSKGSEDIVLNLSEDLKSQNALIQGNINLYNKGLSLGNDLDINASGYLEDVEIDPYLKEMFPEGDVPDAFRQGLKGWTLDPERRAALQTQRLAQELTRQELKEREAKFEFLPQQLQNQLLLEGQALEKGVWDVKLLGASYEEAGVRKEQMEQALALGKLQLEAGEVDLEVARQTLDSAEFDEDVKTRDYVIRTAGEAIVGNLEAQTGIGAGIMANVSIRDNNSNYSPIFTLLTTPVTDTTADQAVELINNSRYVKNIRQDLLGLVEAYRIGKGEEQLPDYSFVLDVIGDIEKVDAFYKDWYSKNSTELEQFVIKEGWDSLEDFMQRLGQNNTQAFHDMQIFIGEGWDGYTTKQILKAIEWENTGILSNMELIADARKAKDQYRFFQSLLEQAQGKALSVGMQYAEPTYSIDDTTSILAPFDYMPLRSDQDIDDIFNENE